VGISGDEKWFLFSVNRLSLSVAAAVLIGSAATTVAQSYPRDYPQWRGRNRDGEASAFRQPKLCPENLTRRWRVAVGEGYATPIVVGNIVYCFSRRAEDEVLAAFDADSGRELWQTRYPAPYKPGSPAAAHGAGPKATPLFHRGKLYTLGISGIMSAFDAATGNSYGRSPRRSTRFTAPPCRSSVIRVWSSSTLGITVL